VRLHYRARNDDRAMPSDRAADGHIDVHLLG
jgi:hypothetical protein